MQRRTVVDSHIHILPGLDDGAGSWEEAVEIAKAAMADGTTALIVTPHYNDMRDHTPRDRVYKELNVFRKYLAKARIALDLYPGAEITLHPRVPELLDKGVLTTINDTAYMLVELPFGEEIAKSEKVILKLRKAGIIPILAHPERHREVREQPDWLVRFIESGCLAQVNAGSLTGERGDVVRDFAENLVSRQLVHLLGSDSHNLSQRKPELAKAIEIIRRLVGEQRAAFMVKECPEKVLAGQPLNKILNQQIILQE